MTATPAADITPAPPAAEAWTPLKLPAWIAGEAVITERCVDVRYPWDGSLTGTACVIGPEELELAIELALRGGPVLSRHQRSQVLFRAAELLAARTDEFATLIRRESGLCIRETRYEVGRALDVLRLAAMETLRDDGQAFSCDISPQGKARRIFTMREPVTLAAAITPFNHPLNTVVHKIAPAIAAGAPLLLKPSERTPLTALHFTELLFEAGLPPWMLSVFVAPIEEVVEPMLRDERIAVVSYTGSTAVGKRIASIAGYKRLCLELGGNDPLIVLADADLDLAETLAAEGAYRNSGQRCTAVKRLLVQREILDDFTQRLVRRTKDYIAGDPANPATRVGTVISEDAAATLERRVRLAEAQGARVLIGGQRRGALMEPTVIADVPRDAEMVCEESFGPLAPIIPVDDLNDAIHVANSSCYGLSSGVVTTDLNHAMEAVRRLRTGTVNINEVPGYRVESSPFGGIKDSGLGVKEGVIEAIKFLTNVKTFSLPW